MTIKDLIAEIKSGLSESDTDQLEVWHGKLSIEYAWICEQLSETKKNRALKEIQIKKILLEKGEKPTETAVQREYYSTEEGQFLSYNEQILKAIGKLITAVRFRKDALQGKVY